MINLMLLANTAFFLSIFCQPIQKVRKIEIIQDTITVNSNFPEVSMSLKSDDIDLLNRMIKSLYDNGVGNLYFDWTEDTVCNLNYSDFWLVIKDKDNNYIYSGYNTIYPCFETAKFTSHKANKGNYLVKLNLCMLNYKLSDEVYYFYFLYSDNNNCLKSNQAVLKVVNKKNRKNNK